MAEHQMIPGSHERPGGPECICGCAWDWVDEVCATQYVGTDASDHDDD